MPQMFLIILLLIFYILLNEMVVTTPTSHGTRRVRETRAREPVLPATSAAFMPRGRVAGNRGEAGEVERNAVAVRVRCGRGAVAQWGGQKGATLCGSLRRPLSSRAVRRGSICR